MLKIAWATSYAHSLPENHRFPMGKYELLPEQLLYEGTIKKENLFTPSPLTENIILGTHTPDYWHKLKNQSLTKSEIRKTGFPMSSQLIHREITIANGSLQASLFALEFGVAMNIAGGTHHAFTNRGEGFCLLNDIAISANYLLENTLVKKILIIDLDVHQGNGTAQIFENESRVFTFSMHGASNYPLHKEKSDWDIGLPDGTGDGEYLQILEQALEVLFREVKPQFVFYQAGVDILESDTLGRLSVTIPGCKQRDKVVIEKCRNQNIPINISMGGGYSKELNLIIEAHANTFRLAQDIFF